LKLSRIFKATYTLLGRDICTLHAHRKKERILNFSLDTQHKLIKKK